MHNCFRIVIIENIFAPKGITIVYAFQGQVSVSVLKTPDQWFGVIYQDDKSAIAAAFERLIQTDVYRTPLYE